MANLSVSDDECVQLAQSIMPVLEYAAFLKTVPVPDEVRAERFEKNDRPLRPDVVGSSLGQQLVSMSPEHDSGFFVVPRIIQHTASAE